MFTCDFLKCLLPEAGFGFRAGSTSWGSKCRAFEGSSREPLPWVGELGVTTLSSLAEPSKVVNHVKDPFKMWTLTC